MARMMTGRATGRAAQVAPVDQAQLRALMQTQAREKARPERRQYRTPGWLDHSFVLPDEQTPARVAAASHPLLPKPRAKAPDPLPYFDRPPSPEVDFAAVVRRADLGRRARIATIVGLVLALVTVVLFQLTGSMASAAGAILFALVTLGAATVRMVLNRAPVPYLAPH
jgi:hypothetical protein